MSNLQYTGTQINYYFVCKRKLWLFTKDIRFENEIEYVFQMLKVEDVELLKEAMAVAKTYYDSTSKKGSENELLMWIELNKDSEKIMKNFTELIEISTVEDGKTKIETIIKTNLNDVLNNQQQEAPAS